MRLEAILSFTGVNPETRKRSLLLTTNLHLNSYLPTWQLWYTSQDASLWHSCPIHCVSCMAMMSILHFMRASDSWAEAPTMWKVRTFHVSILKSLSFKRLSWASTSEGIFINTIVVAFLGWNFYVVGSW